MATIAAGGGGAGLGGAVFVENGGSVTVVDTGSGGISFSGNSAIGGLSGGGSATNGSSDGNDLFLMRGTTTTFNISAGLTDVFNPTLGNNDGTANSGTILNKTGLGTLILTANSPLLSGTTVSAGTLDLSNINLTTPLGGTMSVSQGATLIGDNFTLQGTINDSGLVIFSQNSPGTFSGSLNGTLIAPGSVEIRGSGPVTFTGTNTNIASTTIDNGATLIGTTNNILGNINANGTVEFLSSSGTVSGAISGSGNILLKNGSALTFTGLNSGFSGKTTIDSTSSLTGTTDSIYGNIVNNNLLTIGAGSLNTNYNGNISGTGSVVASSGQMFFGGTNSYTGGTTINNTAYLIGTTSSLQGNFQDNGTLKFIQFTPGTFAGNITGSGNFAVGGTGPITLTGSNNYTGNTYLDGGATLITSTSNVSATIFDNGLLKFNNPTAATYAGVIAGAGQVEILGQGPITFTGPNTYGGGTIVDSNATLIGSVSSLQGNISTLANSNVDFAATSGTYHGNLTGSGTVNIMNGSAMTFSGMNSGFTGTTTVDSTSSLTGTTDSIYGRIVDNNLVTMSAGAINSIYGGTITGSGRLDIASGVVTFTGANSNVTGGTTVEGTLINNGSMASSVTVNNGGTLMGTGSVGATTIQSGGILHPGTVGSPLTVNGNLNFASGSNLTIAVNPTNSEQVVVNGAANINAVGSTFQLNVGPGTYTLGNIYTVLNTSGGLTGQFGTNILPSPGPNEFFAEKFLPNAMQLVVLPTTIGSGDMYANISNVAIQTTTVEMQQVSNRLSLLAGPDSYSSTVETANRRRGSLQLASYGGGNAQIRKVSVAPYAEDDSAPVWHDWAIGYGLSASFSGGFNYGSGGTVFGFDRWIDDRNMIGVLGGYSGTSLSQQSLGGSGQINAYQTGLYELHREAFWYISNIDAYSGETYNVSRQVPVPGTPIATGSSSGNQWTHYTEIGSSRTDETQFWAQPFFGVQYIYLGQTGVTENGGGNLNMLTNYETVNSIRSSLGVRYTTELSQGSVRYVPQAAARYQHEFGNGTQLLTSSFQGAPAIAYATAAANTGNDFGLFTLGGTAILSDRHTLYANVDAQIAANYRAIIGSAGFQFSW